MKKLLFSSLTLLQLWADPLVEDQFLTMFGLSGYPLLKVLDFAQDHGFRYLQILSYELSAFDHTIQGQYQGELPEGGRYFELQEAHSKVTFLCFEERPKDAPIIDLETYEPLLAELYEE